MVTFTSGFMRTYADAGRFLAALPFLGVAIVGIEGLQHFVEWQAGMYVSSAGAHHAALDMGRMISGSLKVIWLSVVAFWVFRFVIGRSPRQTMHPGGAALRRYAGVMIFMILMAAITLWPPVLAPAGAAQRAVSIAAMLFQLVLLPLGAALTPWVVGAALGDPQANPLSALKRAWGSIWWAIGLSLATELPLMAAHYGLGLGAIGKPGPVAVAMLIADAVLVGYLGVALATAQVVVAERMAERTGEHLVLLA
jgi:hypothetical protein